MKFYSDTEFMAMDFSAERAAHRTIRPEHAGMADYQAARALRESICRDGYQAVGRDQPGAEIARSLIAVVNQKGGFAAVELMFNKIDREIDRCFPDDMESAAITNALEHRMAEAADWPV